MQGNRHTIVDGPDKPALQRSLALPEEYYVHFRFSNDGMDAEILRMEEGADGFTFELLGRLASGSLKGETFDALYSVQTRSGWLEVREQSSS